MQTVKVSGKFQIAVPATARRRLGIKEGDRLLVDIRGNHLLLMREPEDYAKTLAGLHAEVWSGIDPLEYVQGERDAWTD
ncbi:MAG: AbrB/MazE/SpoVT family DNA-binding domain-containing protein [Chloroflexota bacterium]